MGRHVRASETQAKTRGPLDEEHHLGDDPLGPDEGGGGHKNEMEMYGKISLVELRESRRADPN